MVRMPIRKDLTRRGVLTGTAGVGLTMLVAACGSGGGLSCAGPGELTRSQQTARDGRRYVERSKVAGKNCANCTFLNNPGLNDPGAACGVCAIDNLPAHPEGYCISWAQAELSGTVSKGAQRA